MGGLAAACTVPEHVTEDPPVHTRPPAVVRTTPRTADPVTGDARGDILARYRQARPAPGWLAAAGWASVLPKPRDRDVRLVHVSDYVSQ